MNKPLEKCTGAHCRCMNLGGQCPNHYYADCESRIEKEAVISTNKEVRSVEEAVEEFWKLHADGGVTASTPDNPPEGWEEWRSEPSEVRDWLRTTLTAERTAQWEQLIQIAKLTEDYKRDWGTSYRPFASLIQEIQAIITKKSNLDA